MTLKSQCQHTKGISNQFRKIEFWLIPKQTVDITISGNGIEKSSSALCLEKMREVRKFAKKKQLYSLNWSKFRTISRNQCEHTKNPVTTIFLT